MTAEEVAKCQTKCKTDGKKCDTGVEQKKC
jgi:hypothetical protein